MLNIINLLKKNETVKVVKKAGKDIYLNKRNIPLNKEWYNIIFTFNKNPIRILPAIHDFLFNLLKRYFNMNNPNFNKKKKSHIIKKIKRSLLNRVWVSTPEIKHWNDKAIITIYIYNKLYSQLKKQLKFMEFSWSPIAEKRHPYKYYKKDSSKLINVTKKFAYLRELSPLYVGINRKFHNNNKNLYIKMIKWLKIDKLKKMEQYKSNIMELINIDKVKLLKGLNIMKIERYNYLINILKKELICLKLKQKMLFNQFKFNEIYLSSVINILETVYRKKIEFNIVLLKHHYLSSSILSQIATMGVKRRKYRGQAIKPITAAIEDNIILNLSKNRIQREDKMLVGVQNIIFKELDIDDNYDSLNKFLLTNKKSKVWSSKYIDNFAMQNIENKSVAGVFIKATGRLTKRYKSQRAVNILRSRGTLKNIYSAYKGYSSVLSRGYSNINVEKTIIHSKVRIGAFGLTGWVSSC